MTNNINLDLWSFIVNYHILDHVFVLATCILEPLMFHFNFHYLYSLTCDFMAECVLYNDMLLLVFVNLHFSCLWSAQNATCFDGDAGR